METQQIEISQLEMTNKEAYANIIVNTSITRIQVFVSSTRSADETHESARCVTD